MRDGKRAYDRHSGTGRGKEIKKGGGGARNWGSDRNEARQAEGKPTEEQKETTEETEPKAVEGTPEAETEEVEEEVAPSPEAEPEPEDNTLSYEEYLASKQRPEGELFAPKQERTSVEDEFFAKAKPREVQEVEDYLVMGGAKQKRKGRKKDEDDQDNKAVELLGFRTGGVDGGRGGRGGRGRGRGGGRGDAGGRDSGRGGGREFGRGGGREFGRGGGRGRPGGRGRSMGRGGRGSPPINVMDESAFPAL